MTDRREAGWARAAPRFLRAVALRPRLWPGALAALWRLAPPGWWHRRPFLPVPDAAYWRFRMETAFSTDSTGRPGAHDVVDYLEWCQRVRPSHR
jgi:hypothetical protein